MRQLLIVFVILAVVFISVLIPLVDHNLTSIIDHEMYLQLETAQDNTTSFSTLPRSRKTRASYHLIYNASDKEYTFDNVPENTPRFLSNLSLLEYDLNTIINDEKHATIENKANNNGETLYYRIIKIETNDIIYSLLDSDDDLYLITIMNSDYSDELIKAIRSGVIYILYGSLIITAVVLLFWCFSLIKPLGEIKSYVDSIKNRQQATLVDARARGDEIGVVANALVDMREEIEKQEKTKEEMIHNISHDLKTPIALIKTYSQSVKDDIYPYGDKDSSMDVILENADRLEHRVKDLLYLNRLDYLNSSSQEFVTFEMKDLLEHIVEQLKTMVDFTIETSLDDVMFVGDSELWRVAIENIITNATRYAKSLIRITLKKDYLCIYNDGEPIDETLIDDLFQPYVKGVKGQFGLGLSIAYKTADMYGYDLTAHNDNPGVSFIFTKKR